jgi:alkylhydroperoxidase/carboxymuconolactone decarboxylase family protein YurZ
MTELTERQRALKETFIADRGYWAPFYDGLLTLDTDFFELFLNFSAHPWRTGSLEPKVREFIYIAIDSSTTHLNEPGLRVHLRNALKYGATKEEIMEVYELVSVLGMHTLTLGVPALLDELGHLDEPGQQGEPGDSRS